MTRVRWVRLLHAPCRGSPTPGDPIGMGTPRARREASPCGASPGLAGARWWARCGPYASFYMAHALGRAAPAGAFPPRVSSRNRALRAHRARQVHALLAHRPVTL